MKTTSIFKADCRFNAGYFGLVHVAHRTQSFFEFAHFRCYLLLLWSWNCSYLVITSYPPCLNYKTLVWFSVGSPSPGLLLIHVQLLGQPPPPFLLSLICMNYIFEINRIYLEFANSTGFSHYDHYHRHRCRNLLRHKSEFLLKISITENNVKRIINLVHNPHNGSNISETGGS